MRNTDGALSEYVMNGKTYTVITTCDNCGEPVDLELGLYEFRRICSCERQRNTERKINRLRRNGLTDMALYDMRFENDKGFNPEMADRAKKYVDHWEEMRGKNIGLMLTGGVGTGKTFFASCIANALIDNGVFVLMTTLSRLINSGFDEEYKEAMRSVEQAELLILDDVGSERDTGFAWERAFDVVDTRIRTGKPLIVTTNLSKKTMEESKNSQERRVYDRIIGACVAITVAGDSIRRKQNAEKTDGLRKIFGWLTQGE